ncbi:MAG: hypothetical protein B6D63_00955 [Candidatus Latescibacteria bacterium 4484_7]|nr:MAG: hypothetical protein B6D63_00955 [Candidatus Latescibacteria bacterium 4484_7]
MRQIIRKALHGLKGDCTHSFTPSSSYFQLNPHTLIYVNQIVDKACMQLRRKPTSDKKCMQENGGPVHFWLTEKIPGMGVGRI